MASGGGNVTRDDLDHAADRLEARMRDGFDGINARLDALNGRTRKNETAIAILEDRSPGRVGMMAGGAVSGAVMVLWQVIEWLRR
jgi:hypothetical protein